MSGDWLACLKGLSESDKHYALCWIRGYDPEVFRRAMERVGATLGRIPEPGLWAVVEAHTKENPDRLKWVCLGKDHFRPNDSDEYDRTWDDLIDPVLIREGLS
jgi:hypothetical protein